MKTSQLNIHLIGRRESERHSRAVIGQSSDSQGLIGNPGEADTLSGEGEHG